MITADFVTRVQKLGQMQTRREAEQITIATLGVLASRLPAKFLWQLALTLPDPLGYQLLTSGGRPWRGIHDFMHRVCLAERVNLAEAVCHIHVVLNVLRETIPAEQFDEVICRHAEELKPFWHEDGSVVVCGAREGYLHTFDPCGEGYDPFQVLPVAIPC